jgi:hypothetical protein
MILVDPSLVIMILQIVVLCLVPVALFAPPRWALLAWLCMTHLDSADPTVAAHAQLGWVNTVRAVVVPLCLLWRFRGPSSPREMLPAGVLAAAWFGYVLLASLWTPYTLAGLKMAMHIAAFFIAVLAVEKAALRGALTKGLFISFLLVSLGLGVLQSVVLGGVLHGRESADQAVRLTSFVTPQQYATLLVALMAIAWWLPELHRNARLMTMLTLGLALYLNGSRTWTLGAMVVMGIAVGVKGYKYASAFCLVLGTAAGTLLLVATSGSSAAPVQLDRTNRLEATIDSLVNSVDMARDVGLGTARFRQRLYGGTIDEILESGTMKLLFGHGTSSGGSVAMRLFPFNYRFASLDPNRVMHNEWLRTLYEWGVLGVVLVGAIVFLVYFNTFRLFRRSGNNAYAGILLSFFPAFMLGLSVENLMASAGTVVAASVALTYAYFAAAFRQTSQYRVIRLASGQLAVLETATCPASDVRVPLNAQTIGSTGGRQ